MIEHFLDPHPDEILYSVWARFSDHVSYPSKSDTFLELFGSRDVRPSIDLPCRLQCFVDALPQDHSYTVDFFINRHTLFPYYQAFLPIERSQIVRNTMTFGIGKGVHERTGIIRRIFPPLWLRFCPVCVAEDKREFGECYWHRLHQLPGVEICPLHKVLLENSSVRMRNGDMSQDSIFSAEEAIKDVPLYGTSSSPFFDTLLFIAQESSYLLEHPLLILDMRILHQKYHTLLAQRGFITPQGRLRVVELFNSFQEYYPQDLLSLLQCNLRNTRQLDSQWLGRIFKRPESKETPVLHPLYHLLVIHFLGFTLKSILSQDIPTLAPFGIGPWPCLNPICKHFRQKKILFYQLPDANKNRTLVGRFSCECGYKYSRVGPDTSSDDAFRGKVLSHGTVWDNKFCELWSNTTVSMNKICSILHTSYSSLNNHARRLELPVPRGSLYTTTNEKRPTRRGKDRFWYREQWLALIENFPGETRAKLKVRAKGIYSWLIYNDREWFDIHSPVKEKCSRTGCVAKTHGGTRWATKSRVLLSLGYHSKQTGNKRYLPQDVSFFHAAYLSFPYHVHHLISL